MNAVVSSGAPGAGAPLPAAARRLSFAGLAPFVLGALLVWFVRDDARDYVVLGLSAYAALVIGFLAGIHWGMLMRRGGGSPREFGLPLLLWCAAWVAAVMPPYAGLVVSGVLLVLTYIVDRKRYPAEGLAHWLTLRFRLSAVASLCCFLAAANA